MRIHQNPRWPKLWQYPDKPEVATYWPTVMDEVWSIPPAVRVTLYYQRGVAIPHGKYTFQRHLERSNPDWWRYDRMYVTDDDSLFLNIEGHVKQPEKGYWIYQCLAQLVLAGTMVIERGHQNKEYLPRSPHFGHPWSRWNDVWLPEYTPSPLHIQVQVFPVSGCYEYPDTFEPL